MAFIFLQENFTSEIRIILFTGLGGIQIVVRNGMQYYVKLKTFSSFTLFLLLYILQKDIQNWKNFMLVSLQDRSEELILIFPCLNAKRNLWHKDLVNFGSQVFPVFRLLVIHKAFSGQC